MGAPHVAQSARSTGSARRARASVGFTNRPQTADSSSSAQASRPPPPPLPPKSESARGHRPEPHGFAPAPAKKPHVHTSGAGEGGMMRPVTQQDLSAQKSVRDRINSRWVNLRPMLKGAARDGMVRLEDIRAVLESMNLGMTEEQLEFCTKGVPPLGVAVQDFLNTLEVPDYEPGYDPIGKSRELHKVFLTGRKTAVDQMRARTARSGSERGLFDTPSLAPPQLGQSQAMTTTMGAGHPRFNLKIVGDVVKRISEVGVPVEKVFTAADEQKSGVINREAFDRVLNKVANVGMLRDQVDLLFSHADVDNTEHINMHDVLAAGKAVAEQCSSRQGSRLNTGESAQSKPWVQHRNVRSPILPRDHFNVRHWTDKVPVSTASIVVPEKGDNFLYMPDWLRYGRVGLTSNWITDGAGQGATSKTRYDARLRRIRNSQEAFTARAHAKEDKADMAIQGRLDGIGKTRYEWFNRQPGAW